MFVETALHISVCFVWSTRIVSQFMYTSLCIRPFLCMESLLPSPPHLYILSSWQVLLGVIDKRQSLANEGVIFKLSMGCPCETAELKNELLDRVQTTTTPVPLLISYDHCIKCLFLVVGEKHFLPLLASLSPSHRQNAVFLLSPFFHHRNDRQVKLAAALIGESWQILQSQSIVDEGVERREKQTVYEGERVRKRGKENSRCL